MDPAACVETVVDIWCMINAKLIARKQTEIDPEVKCGILKESVALYITHIINEKKYTPSPKSVSGDDPTKCKGCGRLFTEKERAFLDDNPEKERICYHCSH